MKRALAIALLAAVGVGFALWLFEEALVLRFVDRAAERRLTRDLVEELPEGLHVAICGAGSPLPDPQRSGPCAAVIAAGRVFVVDAGSGSARVLARMNVNPGRIAAVFLTHFHSDHLDGLGELLLQRWVNGGHPDPALLRGPVGVENVAAGLALAYRADVDYRVAHHGEEIVPRSGAGAVAESFRTPPAGRGLVVFDADGVEVTAFRVEHDPVEPAVGYRFDHGGRSVVFSGDTVKSANLEGFARGADLLVHEALDPKLVGRLTAAAERAGRDDLSRITRDILDYHTTPLEAAESARAAGVRHLLYTHIVPPLLFGAMERVFLAGVADVWNGPVTVARDGTLVVMPAGSDEIETRELL